MSQPGAFPEPSEDLSGSPAESPESSRRKNDPHAGPPSPPLDMHPAMRFLVLAFATGLGTGFSPFASGTAGSLLGVGLFWLMAPPNGPWFAYIVALLVFLWMAILVSSAAEGFYGKKDDGRVVIDEIVGYLVTMLYAPHTLKAVVVGFALFRLFDVVKPPPARQMQAFPGGLGIVLDDIFAGAYACLALHIILHFW